MKKYILTIILLSITRPVMAASGGNPGMPFVQIQEGLDRNYQATKEIPAVVAQNITELLPKAPPTAAQRWISPYWVQMIDVTNHEVIGNKGVRAKTEVFIFNPSTYDAVMVTVKALSPDGLLFDGGGYGTDLPVAVTIPPFGQVQVAIRDNGYTNNRSHTGSVIIEADGPVLPDGQITTTFDYSEPDTREKRAGRQVRAMTWYPDHTYINYQGQQDPLQVP